MSRQPLHDWAAVRAKGAPWKGEGPSASNRSVAKTRRPALRAVRFAWMEGTFQGSGARARGLRRYGSSWHDAGSSEPTYETRASHRCLDGAVGVCVHRHAPYPSTVPMCGAQRRRRVRDHATRRTRLTASPACARWPARVIAQRHRARLRGPGREGGVLAASGASGRQDTHARGVAIHAPTIVDAPLSRHGPGPPECEP